MKIGGTSLSWIDTLENFQKLLLFVIFVIPLQFIYIFLKSRIRSSNKNSTWVKRENNKYVCSSTNDILKNIRDCSGAKSNLKLAKLYLMLIPVLLIKHRSHNKSGKELDSDIYMH